MPWYSESYDPWIRNCVDTYQQFYLDVGATAEQVGNPDNPEENPTIPEELYGKFVKGQPVGERFGGCSSGGSSVSSAASGGVESRPLWLGQRAVIHTNAIGQRLPPTLKHSSTLLGPLIPSQGPRRETAQRVTLKDATGVRNAASTAGMNHVNASRRVANSFFATETGDGLLVQFIPSQGPRGEVARYVTPQDVLGKSNAVSAAGIDYIDNATGKVIASIFAAETVNSVYEHDHAVCTRVQNYEVNDILTFPFDGQWWWAVSAAKPSVGYSEVAMPLTIRLDGSQAIVDSRYVKEYYPTPISGTVLNYQIRAKDLSDAMFFLDSILSAAAQKYNLLDASLSQPPLPTLFARTAIYRYPTIHLIVENQGQAETVRFFGPIWREPSHGAEEFVEFTVNVPEGRSEVTLTVGPIHDAVIYIEARGFLDKVYVANGYWFAWDDSSGGGTSHVSLKTGEIQHPPIAGTVDWFISPPLAEMTGWVTSAISWSHIGIGYAFMQGREPIDLTGRGAAEVAFWARGDGKQYRVKLESASVKDNDYHGALFTAPPEWELVVIPFSELEQEGWGQPVAWTGKDIHTISSVTVDRPHDSVHLVVDRISFMALAVPDVPPVLSNPQADPASLPKAGGDVTLRVTATTGG